MLLRAPHNSPESFLTVTSSAARSDASHLCQSVQDRTRLNFDEQDAAVAIMEPYAYGEKPEEVEVRLDDHRAPC